MNINEFEPTRDRILQSAKFNFYHIGYKKTTIAKIFENIDIPSGVFTYHFKKKDILVQEIYRELFKNIDALILKNYPNLEKNYFLKQAVLSKIYYQIILDDAKNKKFYGEVLEKDSNYRVNKSITDPIFEKYLEEFKLILSKEQFEIISILNAGARREFFIHYFRNNLPLSPYEVSDYCEAIIPLLMRIDKNIVDSTLLQATSIAKSIDHSSVKFLV